MFRMLLFLKWCRADVLDFRSGHVKTGVGAASINKMTCILKTILKEAYFWEDIDRDPTAGIGKIKEHKKEKRVFTRDELKMLFLEKPGIWGDL